MMFYRIYQILIFIPVMLVVTALTAIVTIIGSAAGGGRWWGYWPEVLWGKLFCILTGVRVKVSGRENIDKKQSYVFVANHQGAYDIFSIYGYLGHNFRWMMKASLRKIPLVGYACQCSHQIYVDKSSPNALRRTMSRAERLLSKGMSIVVFPEGSRTLDGRMHAFKRGAFMLAREFSLPVVPLTIDGSFDVLPRNGKWPKPAVLRLTIHKPIMPGVNGHDEQALIKQSAEAVASALPERSKPLQKD